MIELEISRIINYKDKIFKLKKHNKKLSFSKLCYCWFKILSN